MRQFSHQLNQQKFIRKRYIFSLFFKMFNLIKYIMLQNVVYGRNFLSHKMQKIIKHLRTKFYIKFSIRNNFFKGAKKFAL